MSLKEFRPFHQTSSILWTEFSRLPISAVLYLVDTLLHSVKSRSNHFLILLAIKMFYGLFALKPMKYDRDVYPTYYRSGILIRLSIPRSSQPEVFCKKGILRNFAKFTGKHLC